MTEDRKPILAIRGLIKSFGGLVASNEVSLDVLEGEIHALIGPNGAGKTTLINQISGEIIPDEGTIVFAGQDITHMKTPLRAQLGLGRSCQIISVLSSFSARENILMAVEADCTIQSRLWPKRGEVNQRAEAADAILSQVGLKGRGDVPANDLAYGEKRQLELAMALANSPSLLVLDEPMAGLGSEESEAMTQLLQGFRDHCTVLLVEHDMDAVFALADTITVLVQGTVIASGPASSIRANAEVRSAYLGDEADAW